MIGMKIRVNKLLYIINNDGSFKKKNRNENNLSIAFSKVETM